MKQRDKLIDYIKGVSIALVVIGHFIESFLLDGKDVALNHWLHNFIYAFHMPLFVFLSGFYIKNSLSLGIVDIAWKKSKSILWPSISFWIVCNFYVFIWNFIHGNPVLSGIESITSAYWFLKLIFLLYILVWCLNKVAKENLFVHLLLALLLLLVGVNLQSYKITYFYLFFISGFICKTYFWPSLFKGKVLILMLSSGVFFFFLYHFEWSKYVSNVIIGVVSIVPLTIHIENFIPNLYLIVLASSGIFCVIYISRFIYEKFPYFNKTIIGWGGAFFTDIYTSHNSA